MDGVRSMLGAMRARAALTSAADTWRKHAFVLGSAVTGMKTCVADILVQTQYEGKESIDWRRNFVFSSFGLCYLGAFQYAEDPPTAYSSHLPALTRDVCASSGMCSTPFGFLASCRARVLLPS